MSISAIFNGNLNSNDANALQKKRDKIYTWPLDNGDVDILWLIFIAFIP